jgi:hypothetical protein
MADNSKGARRLGGGLLWRRKRKRWAIATVAIGVWLAYLLASGSVFGSTALLLTLVVVVIVFAVVLRSMGVGMDHPLVQPLTTRPWRNGRDVLQLALQHLGEVFIITPNGSLLAPSAVELRMNPADVDSLAEVIDLALVNAHAAEAYEAEVAARSARILRDVPVEVSVVEDPEVPLGRYRIRQRKQVAAGAWAGADAGAAWAGQSAPSFGDGGTFGAGGTFGEQVAARTMMTGEATMSGAPQNPLLRLVTGSSVAETRMSGARAGRARVAELMLPNELTVSRLHARFSCAEGEWRMIGLGRNGIVVNGTPLAGEQLIRDGDMIRWGRQAGAPTSRVQIR